VLLIGLIPGLGAVWAIALVTAVCSGEVVADLIAANPDALRFRGATAGEPGG